MVSLTEELPVEPKVHLKNPYLLSGKSKLALSRFPEHTTDEHILLSSDCLLTVCTPTDEVRSAYLSKTGMSEEELIKASKPVILTEEDDPDPIHDDEYEPRYIEEPTY